MNKKEILTQILNKVVDLHIKVNSGYGMTQIRSDVLELYKEVTNIYNKEFNK